MTPHAPEQVAREEVAGGLGQRQADHDHVRLAQQVVQPIGLPERHPAEAGDVLDVDRQHAHAEREGALGDRAAGAAEADDAQRALGQLPLLLADRLAQAVVGPSQRRVQAARERQQQGERVLGQVDADLALLAGQDHVAGHQLRRQDRVDAGADRVVVAQAPGAGEDVVGHAAEQRLGVGDLLALRLGVPGLDQGRAGPGRFQDPPLVVGRNGGTDHVRRVDDFHRSLSMTMVSTHCPSSWPCSS